MQRVESLCREHGGKETSEWMDNHEVCRRLRISPRTLQTLRDNGTLAFTKIGNRTYRPDDWASEVGNVEDKRKEARWKAKPFERISRIMYNLQYQEHMSNEIREKDHEVGKGVPLEFRQAAGLARKVVGKTATVCLWR